MPIEIAGASADELPPEDAAWSGLAIERLESEWDNPNDAIYDNWRTLYGVPAG